jgi:hypothetical protein
MTAKTVLRFVLVLDFLTALPVFGQTVRAFPNQIGSKAAIITSKNLGIESTTIDQNLYIGAKGSFKETTEPSPKDSKIKLFNDQMLGGAGPGGGNSIGSSPELVLKVLRKDDKYYGALAEVLKDIAYFISDIPFKLPDPLVFNVFKKINAMTTLITEGPYTGIRVLKFPISINPIYGDCSDHGEIRDASISFVQGPTGPVQVSLCLSLTRLARFSAQDLEDQLKALLVHELTHLANFDEATADKIQRYTYEKLMKGPDCGVSFLANSFGEFGSGLQGVAISIEIRHTFLNQHRFFNATKGGIVNIEKWYFNEVEPNWHQVRTSVKLDAEAKEFKLIAQRNQPGSISFVYPNSDGSTGRAQINWEETNCLESEGCMMNNITGSFQVDGKIFTPKHDYNDGKGGGGGISWSCLR